MYRPAARAAALMELQTVLAVVAARYRLDRVPCRPVEMEPSVTLRPRSGPWTSVYPRATVH